MFPCPPAFNFQNMEAKKRGWSMGYSRIDNGLLENLAASDLNGSELRVVLALFRKIQGWNKISDKISRSQIMELTKLSRATVTRSLKNLIKKGIIFNTSKKFFVGNFYFGGLKTEPLGGSIQAHGGLNSHQKRGSRLSPTKYNTKDTIQNTGGGKNFLDIWSEKYRAVTGYEYISTHNDRNISERIMTRGDEKKINDKIEQLLKMCQSQEVWWAKEGLARFQPSTLDRHWNEIIPEREHLEKIMQKLARQDAENKKQDWRTEL